MSDNTFTGEFLHTLDTKGRINIPARFRLTLSPENHQTLVITRGLDPCIIAYPLIEWQKVEESLRSLSSASRVYRSFVRGRVRHATPVEFDQQGRIQIPVTLREYASIGREVLIIGMVNKVELWNPKRLEEVEKSTQSQDASDYDKLADRIPL